MRVAHVTSFRPQSANGVHVAAARLTAHLAGLGADVEVWHFRRDREDVEQWTDECGVEVVELPFPAFVDAGALAQFRRMPAVTRRWLREREQDLDGLHFHSVFQPESWYIAHALGTPFCISPHGGYEMFLQRSWRSAVKRPLWAAFERRLLGRARFVHAVSAGDAETVRRLGVAVPVSIVPNGVDIPDGGFPPIADGAPWLFIGRLHAEGKGLDALIEGYAIASQRISLPVLLIRGPDFRGGRATLELLIHRLGLGDRVEVGGPVAGDEKRRLLESCSLFLLPSRREGLPLSVLEALAAARPVAVTLGTNLDEAVRRSGAGFVIAAPAAQAVAETLEAAAAVDPRQLTEMGRRGQALAREEFSWNRAAGTVNDLYERHFA